MEGDVLELMQKVSKEVDDFIQSTKKTKCLKPQDYQELKYKVYDTFQKAGFTGSIHPEDGRKWRDEQNKKLDNLINFMTEHDYKLKVRSLGYGTNDEPLGLVVDWEEK